MTCVISYGPLLIYYSHSHLEVEGGIYSVVKHLKVMALFVEQRAVFTFKFKNKYLILC